LNLTDITNATQALASLQLNSIVTATGALPVASFNTIWKPTIDATTTFTLPATGVAILNETHKFINQSAGTYAMRVAANTSQTILMPNGSGTSLALPKPGDSIEVRYISSGQWVIE
jgi:hypothetical protein